MQCLSCKKYVIVLACGRGKRMKSDIPKQFLLLNNKPIVMTTINNLYNINKDYIIILVLNKEDKSYWHKLKEEYSFDIPLRIVYGGKERYDSVKNALNAINEEDEDALVAIHDGVRPFINKEIMDNCFLVAKEKGNAVCCIACNDSVRIKDNSNENKMIDRKKIFLIQTPQCFRLSLIKRAYEQTYKEDFTDDASYVENLNEKINLILGRKENIKITLPIDITIAKAIEKEENERKNNRIIY